MRVLIAKLSRQTTIRRFRFALFAPLLATIILSLVACGEADTPGTFVNAPQIDFECGFAQAGGCITSNTGKTVFIGLHQDTSFDCASEFFRQSLVASFDQLAYSFDYSSFAQTTSNGAILTGVATHWVNSELAPVFSLEKKTYRVCAFIDLNNNKAIDANEPIEESVISVGSDFLPLSNWTDY